MQDYRISFKVDPKVFESETEREQYYKHLELQNKIIEDMAKEIRIEIDKKVMKEIEKFYENNSIK